MSPTRKAINVAIGRSDDRTVTTVEAPPQVETEPKKGKRKKKKEKRKKK